MSSVFRRLEILTCARPQSLDVQPQLGEVRDQSHPMFTMRPEVTALRFKLSVFALEHPHAIEESRVLCPQRSI